MIEEALRAGFRAMLDVRGAPLKVLPNRAMFNGLINPARSPTLPGAADSGLNVLDPGNRQMAEISVLREDLNGYQPQRGDVLEHTLTRVQYRVLAVHLQAGPVTVNLICEIEPDD